MPTTLNVTLSDDDYQRAREVKEQRGLTWEGFIKEASYCLAQERDIDIADTGVSDGIQGREGQSSDREPQGERAHEPIDDGDLREEVRERVAEQFSSWGSGRVDDGTDAVLAAYDYLREQRQVSMREFVNNVAVDHPAGYSIEPIDEGERYRGAWWRKLVSPILEELPNVEKPGGGQPWRYRE